MKSFVAILFICLFQLISCETQLDLELAETEFYQEFNMILIKAREIDANVDATNEQKLCAIEVKDKAIVINIHMNIEMNSCNPGLSSELFACKVKIVRAGIAELQPLLPAVNACIA